jgi:spore coat protein U-like protein
MQISKAFKPFFAAALCGSALSLVPAAQAATATTTFAVTATVQATCTVTATALGFGTYVPSAASAATSTISVTCTNTTPYNVGLNAGVASGATVTNRSMTGPGSALLNYALTSDSGHTTNWGNSTGSWVGGTGNGSAQALTVYGQVAAGQYVAPGAYSDTITATVNY